ncbi:MAG: NAD-dependent epimerase/dehydratase family protein [Hyphomonas sp.]|uniref:NAD-dependent epimerase/dehydratase family protein n=1 Tax=Hyphomonas sp. TaxID=87 RepID=UPI001853B82D|nr:NAD-dependent epimerase/dehydratase family protein [Hyphomonas sp.]MBU3919880.1 NAD-dependent epimerase/dehydratase family protein [Alphaproteobacteria bacterium]MBU4063902.1 NAD-dependent epimerase/dehydratase family protein [Alphaproteobacteria bacterium]MBU4163300.1 NAD-dependent epimerase/dehydratase family protein [Alphaproteobacteria bacterium]
MKVLITGAAGQVGSHVAELMLARGDTVLGLDNFATGRPEHLPAACRFAEGSIADRDFVLQAFENFRPDVVIHTAASYKDPEDWYSDALTNVVGGANVIQASKAMKVSRFIYFQTALCYGVKPDEQPITLSHPKNPANSSYAISKTAAEDYLEISGLDFVTFRLANVIGPRNVSGPLPIFFSRLRDGKRCFVTEARRDFVYAGDLARTVVRAADGTGHGTYHFSSGKDIAIRELYDAVVEGMKLNDYPEPDVRPLGPDDAATILLDPSRTFEDFGEIRFTPLSEFVPRAIDYYRSYGVLGEYTHLKLKPETPNGR